MNYEIVDNDYDFSTQDPVIWYASADGTNENRWPCDYQTPCHFNPMMKVLFGEKDDVKQGEFIDKYENNQLTSRVENYKLPTLQITQLFSNYNPSLNRMPSIEDAFKRCTQLSEI